MPYFFVLNHQKINAFSALNYVLKRKQDKRSHFQHTKIQEQSLDYFSQFFFCHFFLISNSILPIIFINKRLRFSYPFRMPPFLFDLMRLLNLLKAFTVFFIDGSFCCWGYLYLIHHYFDLFYNIYNKVNELNQR